MPNREEFTPAAKAKMEAYLGRPSSQCELCMIPYLQYTTVNDQKINSQHLNGDVHEVLKLLREAGHIVERRAKLRKLADRAREIFDDLEELHNAEEEAFENMPENLQYDSERGEAMQDAMNAIGTARGTAEMLVDKIEEVLV